MSFELPSSDQKADYVLEQFDRIASRYDLANDLISMGMHRLWKARAIKELGILPGGKYLDVCTGTGDLAMSMATAHHFNGEVVGLDFSSQMLSVARSREQRALKEGKLGASCCAHDGANSAPRLEWRQGDAQALPFENNTFDGAIISFGLRNLTNLQKGLDEMARVVKPSGTVINLDLGQPDMPIFTPLFLFFFHNIVPIIGEIVQNDRKAYTYLPESRKNYPHPTVLSQMFESAGLTDVRWVPLAFGSVAMHIGRKPAEAVASASESELQEAGK